MRDLFVARWEEQYADKYVFQSRDGANLSRMIKQHPQLVERWPQMVTRYLANDFWAGKNHPLTGLVTRPGEFSTEPANGTHLPERTVVTREASRSWLNKRQP